MDPLTSLLSAPRAEGAFLLRCTMTAPWSVRIQDQAPLTVVAMVDGTACYAPEEGEPVDLVAGDLLLIARPDPYLFADAPDRPPQAVIHPGGRCETPAGASLELPLQRGVRTWGNDADGRDVMLVGTYPRVGEAGGRVLRALPAHLVISADAAEQRALLDLLAREMHGDGPGQASLLDRLLDALVVAVIRSWATAPDATSPGWLDAGADPEVRGALELMHDRVAEPWTVETLASRVGLSRAGFSRRFSAAVGDSPMAYLTAWRMAVAADLLRDSTDPVQRIASAVGYQSPFTFSTAFKRHHGVSPLGYRQQHRARTA